MKLTLDNISHVDFFNRLEIDIKEILHELELKNFRVETTKNFADIKVSSIKQFLLKSLISNSEVIIDLLDDRYSCNIFDRFYSNYTLDISQPEIIREVERLDRFRKSLEQVISYLSTIDSLYGLDSSIEISAINEKQDFILSKLNSLFATDEYYSIERILMLNGIKYRNGECREIAFDLYNRGYLTLLESYGDSDFSKITVKGALYITRKLNQKNKKTTKTLLDKRIDNIIEHLEKLGYGQEIIFNEIDELRELQHKLTRKSWSQLLKGKLIDLAISKAIGLESISFVYEYLTNENFKMIK